jgi:hypothetical protein
MLMKYTTTMNDYDEKYSGKVEKGAETAVNLHILG